MPLQIIMAAVEKMFGTAEQWDELYDWVMRFNLVELRKRMRDKPPEDGNQHVIAHFGMEHDKVLHNMCNLDWVADYITESYSEDSIKMFEVNINGVDFIKLYRYLDDIYGGGIKFTVPYKIIESNILSYLFEQNVSTHGCANHPMCEEVLEVLIDMELVIPKNDGAYTMNF